MTLRALFRSLLLLGALLFGPLGVVAQDPAPASEDSTLALPTAWDTVYLVLLSPGPTASAARAPEALQALMQAHIQYQLRLQQRGQAIAAGGLAPDSASSLIGLTILRAASPEEALRLAQADPAVAAGHFAAAVRAWYVPAGQLPEGALAARAAHEPLRLAERLEEVRKRARAYRDSLKLPALTVAVAVGDEVVLADGFGWSDPAARTPAGPASPFRIGSVSKLFTATAAARLAEAGRLDLDAPIGRYLPDLPGALSSVTARQLAGHLGGVRHYRRDEFISTQPFDEVTGSLDRFLADSLLHPPGAGYTYSSYGYNLLGAVLERASGTPFRLLIRSEVLAPLGLEATWAEEASRPSTGTRYYWQNRDGEVVEVPPADLSDRWPSGGYVSTAADLARFGTGVLRDDYLSPAARTQLFTSQRTAGGAATRVGLGWRVGTDAEGRPYVHHGGEALGSRAFLLVYPEARVAVALLTNLSFAPLGEAEAKALARPFLE